MSEVAWDSKHDVANLRNFQELLGVVLDVGKKLGCDVLDAELDLGWVLGRLDDNHGLASRAADNIERVVLDVVLKVLVIELAALHPFRAKYRRRDVLRDFLVRIVTH